MIYYCNMIIVFLLPFVQLAMSCTKIISLPYIYILKLYRLSIECSFNINTDLSNTYV